MGPIQWDGAFKEEAIRLFHTLNPSPDSTLYALWLKMQETSLALHNYTLTRKHLQKEAREAEDAYYTYKYGPDWRNQEGVNNTHEENK